MLLFYRVLDLTRKAANLVLYLNACNLAKSFLKIIKLRVLSLILSRKK